MSLNDVEDKKLKSECIKLLHIGGMYKCMVMNGTHPLIAEMFDTWDSTYDEYCTRCIRFISKDPEFRDWSCIHILGERCQMWIDIDEKDFNQCLNCDAIIITDINRKVCKKCAKELIELVMS